MSIDCRLGFILHTVTRFLRPRLQHYYGLICHLTLTMNLNCFLFTMSEHTVINHLLQIQCQASPVITPAPCKVFHPQALHMVNRVLGFALFCTLTPMCSRIRFAFAMYTLLLMASFRPHRWPVTPLPFRLPSPRLG